MKYTYCNINDQIRNANGYLVSTASAVNILNSHQTTADALHMQIDEQRERVKTFQTFVDAADAYYYKQGSNNNEDYLKMLSALDACTPKTAEQLRDEAFKAADKAISNRHNSTGNACAERYYKARHAYEDAIRSDSLDEGSDSQTIDLAKGVL